jgi:REP element-mobilizing transposase RayT
MSRPLRLLAPGLVYHVMARGNARMTIYHDDIDYRRFLELLETVVDRFGIECWAYCLMPNHYHAVLRTPTPNLSQAIRYLNGVYALRWNRRHARSGHVFQGRFKSQVVDDDSYLLVVSRYVVLNPVRAGLTARPGGWRWSSYLATAGLTIRPSFLDVDPVLRQFGGVNRRSSRRRYVQYVNSAVPDSSTVGQDIRSDRRVLGSHAFAQQFRIVAEQASREVPLRERHLGRPDVQHVLQGALGGHSLPGAITHARRRGYSLIEIARALGLPPATVGRYARRAVASGLLHNAAAEGEPTSPEPESDE